MLASFKGQMHYELKGTGTSARIKFVKVDPLPLVNVCVNGGKEVTFSIDTGGSEVTLDTDFAEELGVPEFGAVQGTFSGRAAHWKFGSGGLSHSHSGIGPSKTCPR